MYKMKTIHPFMFQYSSRKCEEGRRRLFKERAALILNFGQYQWCLFEEVALIQRGEGGGANSRIYRMYAFPSSSRHTLHTKLFKQNKRKDVHEMA